MNWIFEMIYPVIKDCETPEEAERAINVWGKKQEPRDYFCGLIAVWTINANWEEFKNKYKG